MCSGNECAPNRRVLSTNNPKQKKVRAVTEICPVNKTTQSTNYVINLLTQFNTNKYLSFVTRSSQPAHLVTLVCAFLVANILTAKDNGGGEPSTYLKVVYLGSFASHLGAQLWMTFVSGLSLYFTLPRHTFSSVQRVLFPRYFLVNAILSWTTLFTFVRHQNDEWPDGVTFQVGALATCFSVELLIRLYMSPKLLDLMTVKNLMEAEAGAGSEVGKHEVGYLMGCPKYLQVHRAFRRLHSTIAVGNMLTMACTAVHLYYLSEKIHF